MKVSIFCSSVTCIRLVPSEVCSGLLHILSNCTRENLGRMVQNQHPENFVLLLDSIILLSMPSSDVAVYHGESMT